uniref:Surfeit locus protein 2 n=2 Tax=Cannabis sativa TaxID=3483 RepID=A0A803NZN8_CANSA
MVEEKEGTNLLGSPTFKILDNGRFKCVETGHEVLDKDKDSYSNSKRCSLGLIDFAVSHDKPPLNVFKQDPLSRSKLVCNITGDTVNKSEEHIWKHINGKRFLNKLEEMETQKLKPNDMVEEVSPEGSNHAKNIKKKKNKKKKDKPVEEIISAIREPSDVESDLEVAEFWMPPLGERWDFDDGGDRWGSDSESEHESDGVDENADAIDDDVDDDDNCKELEELSTRNVVEDDDNKESEELLTRTKRMSIEIGPSNFTLKKKKLKKNTLC